jgi:hypothetical protein
MNKIDLIIDALEAGLKLSDGFISEWNQINKALAAAHELKALKPVVEVQSFGEKQVFVVLKPLSDGDKLYTAPPRKELIGLTELEIAHGLEKANLPAIFSYRAAARAGIDAFKEKNT